MLRIASHQFAAYLWIQALPESRKIRRRLHGPLIRGQQMNHHRRSLRPDSWRLAHPEKVLQARRNPWRFSALIMNFGLSATLQAYARWCDLTQPSTALHLLFKDRNKIRRGFFQLCKAPQASTKSTHCMRNIRRVEACKFGAPYEFIQSVHVDKTFDASLQRFLRKHFGCGLRVRHG